MLSIGVSLLTGEVGVLGAILEGVLGSSAGGLRVVSFSEDRVSVIGVSLSCK